MVNDKETNSSPQSTDTPTRKSQSSSLRRWGFLIAFVVLLAGLYLWFLHPWYPIYDFLPPHPPPPPRTENAFYPFYEAAAHLNAGTGETEVWVKSTHEYASTGITPATLQEIVQKAAGVHSEPLASYRSGAERPNFYIPLEYYSLTLADLRATEEGRRGAGVRGFLVKGLNDPIEYGPEDFILEGAPSEDLAASIEDVFFLAHLDLLIGQLLAADGDVMAASPYLERALHVASLLEREQVLLLFGSDLRDITIQMLAFLLRSATDDEYRAYWVGVLDAAGKTLPALDAETFLAAQEPILRGKKVGRHLRGEIRDRHARETRAFLLFRNLTVARMGLLSLCTAHELVRSGSGSEIGSLEALAPYFPDGLPKDPFSGSPYRMVSTESGVTFYSVGPNGVDEQAKVVFDPVNGLDSDGDILPYW